MASVAAGKRDNRDNRLHLSRLPRLGAVARHHRADGQLFIIFGSPMDPLENSVLLLAWNNLA